MRTFALLAALCALALADDTEQAHKDAVKACVEQLTSREVGVKMQGLRTAGSLQDAKLVAPLSKLLKDKELSVRLAAIQALAGRELKGDRKKAALALASRMKAIETNEKLAAEYMEVIQALHDLAQPATIKALLDVKHGSGREVIRARARAVGNVPHKDAIKRLIQFGYKNRRGEDATQRAAHDALRYATGENIPARKMDGWRQWWKENEATFDVQAAAAKRAEKRVAQADKEAKRAERRKAKERKKRRKGGEDK